jgi:hypothetical protein
MLFTVGHGTWHKKDRLIEALKKLYNTGSSMLNYSMEILTQVV